MKKYNFPIFSSTAASGIRVVVHSSRIVARLWDKFDGIHAWGWCRNCTSSRSNGRVYNAHSALVMYFFSAHLCVGFQGVKGLEIIPATLPISSFPRENNLRNTGQFFSHLGQKSLSGFLGYFVLSDPLFSNDWLLFRFFLRFLRESCIVQMEILMLDITKGIIIPNTPTARNYQASRWRHPDAFMIPDMNWHFPVAQNA